MAADAGVGVGAFRHLGRCVVRAAGAEVGRADERLGCHRLVAAQALEFGDLPLDALAAQFGLDQAFADGNATSVGSSAPLAGNSHWPNSSLLAEHLGAVGEIEQLLLDLGFDQASAFLRRR